MGEYVGPRRARPFLRYCEARCLRWQERRAFEVYVSEAVRLVGENTGKYIKEPFSQLVEARPEVEQRRPEEVAAELVGKGVLRIEPARSDGQDQRR